MTDQTPIKVVFVPRERDEEVLHWLQLHDEGHSFGKIAKMHGVGSGSVSRLLNKIRAEDAAAHGEALV